MCSDCKVELQNEIEIEIERYEFVEMDYVYTAASDIEANMFTELFETNGIQTMKKYREAGGYLSVYMGETSFGIDLFVDKEKRSLAIEILKPLELESIEEDTKTEKSSSWLKKIFIIFCVILFLLL